VPAVSRACAGFVPDVLDTAQCGLHDGRNETKPRPLLERNDALGVLGTLAGEAAAGRGRLVFVGGEAGVGKTALLGRFAGGAGGRVGPPDRSGPPCIMR
jgi:hypothetical protein